MNIFYTSESPIECAVALDDRRVNKMIVESCQMLSTALRYHGVDDDDLYKACYVNHPCTVWTRASRANFLWLVQHTGALCFEFNRRFGSSHASKYIQHVFIAHCHAIPNGDLTPHANCSLYKDESDTILAYRKTMIDKWNNHKPGYPPRWTGVSRPVWYIN